MANVRMETANCSQKQMFPWCSRFWFRAHDFQSHFEVFDHRNVEPTLQQVVVLIDSSQQLTSQRILNILISFCYFYSKITLCLSRAHFFSKSPINLANNFGSYLSQQCFGCPWFRSTAKIYFNFIDIYMGKIPERKVIISHRFKTYVKKL